MSTATTSKVRTALVIGGGIAGPVVATALLKAGIQATVYEAYPTLAEGIGGGLALAPNGLAALGLIGADDAVRALATPITGTVMAVGRNSRRLPSLAGVEPLQIVGRGDLHRVLHDRAAESGVRFEYGKRLVGAIEGPDSVTAKFDDGSTATADVLIGADGVRSTVRTPIDPEAPAAGYTGLLSFQGYIDAAPDIDPEPGVMTFAFGKRAYYLFWKMADGRVTWGANLPSKQYMSLSDARAIPSGVQPRNCWRTLSIRQGGAPSSAASAAAGWDRDAAPTRPMRRTPCARALVIRTGDTPTARAQRRYSSASARRPSTARSATANPEASARPR